MKSKIFTKILRFFTHHTPQYPEKEPEELNGTPDTKGFERCVICGDLTSVPISMPVDCRDNYVIGLGQICAECASKEYQAAISAKHSSHNRS